jgi:hypothetical protein
MWLRGAPCLQHSTTAFSNTSEGSAVHAHNTLLQGTGSVRVTLGALLSFTIAGMSPALLAAQTSPPDSPGCAQAVLEVRAGRLPELLQCPQSGPPALAKVWESPPVDPELLNTLSHATAGVRDMRVLPTVIKAAENPALLRPVRLAALRTLVRLYDPTLEVDFKTRPEDGANGRVFVMMGKWSSTPPGADGAFPITQGGRSEILATLERICDRAADVELRRVAARLRRALLD